jgi:hypothetical protein
MLTGCRVQTSNKFFSKNTIPRGWRFFEKRRLLKEKYDLPQSLFARAGSVEIFPEKTT